MKFVQEFEEALSAFEAYQVNYMLVGGYAVNFHGYERTTGDLDIWVKPSIENMDRILSALKFMDFDNESINHIKGFDVKQPFLFHIGDDPYDIEVFNFVTGVKYEDAEPHKIPFQYSEKLSVYFISIHDLIVNKMIAGRPKDKLDVEMLQRIQKL